MILSHVPSLGKSELFCSPSSAKRRLFKTRSRRNNLVYMFMIWYTECLLLACWELRLPEPLYNTQAGLERRPARTSFSRRPRMMISNYRLWAPFRETQPACIPTQRPVLASAPIQIPGTSSPRALLANPLRRTPKSLFTRLPFEPTACGVLGGGVATRPFAETTGGDRRSETPSCCKNHPILHAKSARAVTQVRGWRRENVAHPT